MINMVFKKISHYVIPAKAGIQNLWKTLDSRFRGNDRLILPLVILIVATVACGDSNDGDSNTDPFDPNAYFDDAPPADGSGAPVKECMTNLQCTGGQLCVAGKCFTPSDKKTGDSDKKKECVINYDCSAGEKCSDGICKTSSSSDSGSGGGKSKKKTKDDGDDGGDNENGGGYVTGSCTDHQECKDFYETEYAICVKGSCMQYPEEWACTADSDCNKGQYCNKKYGLCEAAQIIYEAAPLYESYDAVYDAVIDPTQTFIKKLTAATEEQSGIVGGTIGDPYHETCDGDNEYPVGLRVWSTNDGAARINGLKLVCKDIGTEQISYGSLVGKQLGEMSDEICKNSKNEKQAAVWAGVRITTDSHLLRSLQIYCGQVDLDQGVIVFDPNAPSSYGNCLGHGAQKNPGKKCALAGPPVPKANGSGDVVEAPIYKEHEFIPGLQNKLITGIVGKANQYNVKSFGFLYKSLGTKSWSKENDDDYLALSNYLDSVETSYLKPLGDFDDPQENYNNQSFGYDAKCPAGTYPAGFRLYGQDPKGGLWLGAIGPFQLLCQYPGDFSAKVDPNVHIFDNAVLGEMNYVIDSVCPTNPYKGPGVLVGLRIRRLYAVMITWQNLCGYVDLKTWEVVIDKTSDDYYGECIGHGSDAGKQDCIKATYDGPEVAPNTTQHTLLVPANSIVTRIKGWAGYGGLGQIHLGYKTLTNQ